MASLLPLIAPYAPSILARQILAGPRILTGAAEDRFPAAVLFADISGFTPLAEALAQQGPAGPEQLSDLLNRCFGRMIAVVEAGGGDVVKFSGDAMTVLFPATEEPLGHAARRALQAATATQAALIELAALPTSVGPVALEMRSGIGAGEVVAMQVGGVLNRWEYVVAGDPVRQAGQAEGQAERGQVRLSPEAEALLHPDPLPQRPLVQTDWSSVTDPAVVANLRCFVPGPVLQYAGEGLRDWLAVLRPMSVLFIGLSGLDYGLTGAAEQLHHFLCTAQAIIYRYQGILRQLAVDDKGTVLIAVFGAPTIAHEEDTLLAVRSALDLTNTYRQTPLQVAAGVATGHVFAGPVGSETRREYMVVGDTVNLAARLMGQAGAGGILCDFGTFVQTRRRMTYESLPPVRVKGKAGLVRVYRPASRPAAFSRQQPAGGVASAMVGRETELARLEEILDAVEAGTGRVLLIEGEAGVGKSRLVQELTRSLRERGLTWLVGAGQSIEQQTPYRAWRDIFSYYFGLDQVSDPAGRQARIRHLAQELIPEQIPRLPLLNDILGLGLPDTGLTAALDPSLRQQSLVLLLLALLRAWTRERPLIVVLEDAHWLDSLSWELAVAIARALTLSRDRLLLVLVTRPLEESPAAMRHAVTLRALPEAESFALATLSPEETVVLATRRLGLPAGGLPEAIAGLVRTRAGGNPFIAEELVLTLRDQGLIRIETDPAGQGDPASRPYRCRLAGDIAQAGQALPSTVQGLILARIDRLSPERQLTLKVGSVIGRTFAYGPLRYTVQQHTAIPDDRLRGHLDVLATLDLTPLESREPDLSYTFRHIITQEVAYGTLLFAQRRALHHTVAEWYESDQQSAISSYYPLLVHHYRGAEVPEKERHYARLAGEQAAAQFANAEAVTYFSRALELTPPDDRAGRCALLGAREKVYDRQGVREAQRRDLAALQELAEALDDDNKCAEVALRQAHYAEATGDYPGAIAAAQATIRLAQAARAGRLEAAGHLQWGRTLWRQGQHDAARQEMEQALDIARRAEALPEGTAGPAQETSPELHALEADCRRNLGNVSLYQGDHPAAKVHYEQALALCRKIGDRPGESALLNNLGSVSANLGDYGGARSYYEQALALKRQIGDQQSEGLVLDNLGSAATNLGDYGPARTYFQQALDAYRAVGDRRGEGVTLNNLGVVSMYQGDYVGAQAHLQQALGIRRELGDRQGQGSTLAYLGLLAHHMGDNESARQYCQQARDTARELGAHHVQGYALTFLGHALAELGNMAEAAAAYGEALAMRRQMGQTNLTMGPLAGLARVAQARGDLAQAQAWVEEILSYLQTSRLDGAEEPFRVYLTCIRVLRASQDPRAADVLASAHQLLEEQAAQVADEAQRRAFLENVAMHREVMREFTEDETQN
jgi:class 3 adenylate cyclase/predicted ATPase